MPFPQEYQEFSLGQTAFEMSGSWFRGVTWETYAYKEFKGRKEISSGEGRGKERPGFNRGEAPCVCLFLLRREHYRRLHQCPLKSPLADIGLHVISKESEKVTQYQHLL